MSWAMKVTLDRCWMMASTTEMAMKTTISPRMTRSCRRWSMPGATVSTIKSRVRVELEASTKEERVDMEAERTRMTTMAMRRSGSPESMAGMMAS